MNEKQLIFDFCNWLTEQGCLYETISYGDDNDINRMIDDYLMDKESKNIKKYEHNIEIWGKVLDDN